MPKARTVLFALTALALLVAPLATTLAPLTFAAEQKTEQAKPYPLKTCLVTGEELGDQTVSIVHDGQEFKFCCKACIKEFNADPKKFHKKLAEAVAKQDEGKKKQG